MGVAWSSVGKMDELGLFKSNNMRILDIGSSNLYSAQSEDIEAFLVKYGSKSNANVRNFSKRLAAGSGYDSVSGGCNESFVGEVFEEAGMHYTAFDIADGYRTTIVDLNRANLPNALKNSFDLVLNFGTTEHILNQLNCFKIIHDATSVGGYIFHSLPAIGYVDHGYLTYTGRCFFDLAGYNEYEIIACWFDGPAGNGSILESFESYSSYFPILKSSLADLAKSEQGKKLIDLKVPNVGINIICRKVKDKPFLGALESSTSVGVIPKGVSDSYTVDGERHVKDEIKNLTTSSALDNDSMPQGLARTLQSTPLLFIAARKIYRVIKGSWVKFRSSQELSLKPSDGSGLISEKDIVRDKPADGSGLTSEEILVRDRLLRNESNAEEANWLYASVAGRGLDFPFEWEEAVLRLNLVKEPGRLDLMARLRYVLVSLCKPVEDEIERAFAEVAMKEEYEEDHQASAARYHAKTGTADMDENFLAIYEHCRAYSMTSSERMFALYKAIQYLEDAAIPGAIVECGVWRGGSMMIAAHSLLERGTTKRELYLFDTYEGLPRPNEKEDIDIWGNKALDGWLPRHTGEESSHWAEASEDEVRRNLLSTQYPPERMYFVKGMVERTIPESAPETIALLRLDTDWYASTKHELEHLYDRLSPNGVLIIDDYGQFKGARKAVDEFFAFRKCPIMLNRIDFSGRIAIKIV